MTTTAIYLLIGVHATGLLIANLLFFSAYLVRRHKPTRKERLAEIANISQQAGEY